MRQRDLRAEWDSDTELRKSIQRELNNWARWSHWSENLGHASQQPWYTKPKDARDRPPPPPVPNVEEAEETEAHLVLWARIIRQEDNPIRRHLENLLLALKMHYLTEMAAYMKARIIGVSRRRFYQMIEEAEYRFWVIRKA
ncbi:MAG: hypothetical protein ACOC8P_00285 [Dichotomicrobium sp.]